jgi:hypothetical protein
MAESTRRAAKPKPRPAEKPAEARYLDIARRGFVDTTRPPPPPERPAAAPRPVAPGRSASALARPEPRAEPAVRELTGRMFVDTAKGEFREIGRPAEPVMTRRQFESEHQRLLRQFGESGDNPGSFSCQGCSNCASCMFCVDCDGCYRCTHSTRCKDGSHLTHCEDCENCHGSAYCVRSRNCTGSSYLVLCVSCSESTYCFGCVGLQKKDFYVLNVKYTRNEYFRIVKALREEMGF